MLELLGAQAAIAIENARLLDQAQKMASTDSLTGLHNRRYFLEIADHEFERAHRYNVSFTICMIDLDVFKMVNDTYGHLTGDKVLQEIAVCCQETVRKVDVLARFGGDELIILMPETSLEEGWRAAERLRDRIATYQFKVENTTIKITASMGIAAVDETCPDLKTLIIRADKALYAAKQNGGNKVATWVE
jgi:diguanylate cyclase (GGDEF)-like protein